MPANPLAGKRHMRQSSIYPPLCYTFVDFKTCDSSSQYTFHVIAVWPSSTTGLILDSSSCLPSDTAWALQPADSDSDDDDDDDGDDRQSTAATTSTAPHTAAADADACTTYAKFVSWHRARARAGTLRPCALLRVLRKPRCCYEHIIRPPDIVCRRTYILPVFLLSFFLLSFFFIFSPPNLRGR